MRQTISLVSVVLIVAGIAGCSPSDNLSQQYAEGNSKGYVGGDGTVAEWSEDQRGAPVVFSGDTDLGTTVTQDDFLGGVVVVNFWYAACAPCRSEAPELKALHEKYRDQGAVFIGVNVRDQGPVALTFAEKFGIEYPSIIDVNSGSAQLGFARAVPPNAVPTTTVLDRQGRVAARILGEFETSILDTLIRDALSEGSQ